LNFLPSFINFRFIPAKLIKRFASSPRPSFWDDRFFFIGEMKKPPDRMLGGFFVLFHFIQILGAGYLRGVEITA
jgi:hypothetical protein